MKIPRGELTITEENISCVTVLQFCFKQTNKQNDFKCSTLCQSTHLPCLYYHRDYLGNINSTLNITSVDFIFFIVIDCFSLMML